ncbi:GNAT family N-acetyltransferase [Mobilitalea sibirica]|uniref:GNAT family N-acetyltransferase n=1 Tax=Mobilitalea sibirica TaxID=1462919 RepID=A0A8J7GX62_9FIRM|nr:N-acetyltransferase [Mobilitalea sibirica]MBH1939654.1 GNAT family N-acetyltransferase [Mobilitalea sibirica]
MNLNIIKAEKKHLDDCKVALQNSDLGRVYFPQENKAINAINEGISKQEILVALNPEGLCLGFVWLIRNGVFHSFPYIHIIAVKEEYRSLGIGREILDYIEKLVAESSKIFLVVDDFNPKAKLLYQKVGYKEVGVIPDLYKKGINGSLMMKVLL